MPDSEILVIVPEPLTPVTLIVRVLSGVVPPIASALISNTSSISYNVPPLLIVVL